MKKLQRLFEKQLYTFPAHKNLFNQYSELDKRVDLPNAPEIRRVNLSNYLKSFPEKPSSLILCEAPGPWGCRFSGIPITGENLLISNALPFTGKQSSLDKPKLKIKKSPPYREYSAGIFWEIMAPFHPNFFVWNTVPLHPHKDGNILGIRTPSQKEVLSFSALLEEMLKILTPVHCIAVGRKAEFALNYAGVSAQYVRHPARGGANIFRKQMLQFFQKIG